MDGFKDHYALLGVAPTAEPDVIRAAYRALAKRYHPDHTTRTRPGAGDHMARLNAAYAILSCPERRYAYDQWLRQLQAPAPHRHNPVQANTPHRPAAYASVLTTYDRRGRLHAYL
jgi:curved DNA-binding protein CbpA